MYLHSPLLQWSLKSTYAYILHKLLQANYPNMFYCPGVFEWGIDSRNVHVYMHTYVRTYVRVCNAQECQFALICTYVHVRSGTHASRALTMEVPVEDKEERRFLTMEDVEDSATGHLQCMCFGQLSAEHSWRLATLRKRKQRTKSIYKRSQEGKKRMRESAKEKSTLWRVLTSQV